MGLFSGGTEIINNGELLEGGIPSGTVVPWSDSSIPSGFLECNAAAVSRSTYATLFGIIGTTYGAGDGSTTFNVPDLRDNVAVGKSGTKNLGSTGGANTVTSSGNVGGSTANATLSTAQLASHSHPAAGGTVQVNNNPQFPRTGVAGETGNTGNAGSGQAHSHNMSANFTGNATSVIQPYLTIVYIIKT
jgi:microcystin-dependent protein